MGILQHWQVQEMHFLPFPFHSRNGGDISPGCFTTDLRLAADASQCT
jgi:hypothetical protein